MSDFFQNGTITTIHNLTDRNLTEIESELHSWKKQSPISLVLPCLISELEGPALKEIVSQLTEATYINEIIIGLDRANKEEFEYARKYFSELPQPFKILWNDGPHMKQIDDLLLKHTLAPRELGKGRNVWYCLGYFLASQKSSIVALHDCDILTYNRSMLARLVYPLANPAFTYSFCKGYYFRASQNKLNGRVTRLLVTPLIRGLKKAIGPNAYLDFLDSFRYPLAGEFSMSRDVVHSIRIPSDWGLEVSVLGEIYRSLSLKQVCQVDIADAYDHKHQMLSTDNEEAGLNKMAIDIAKAIFRRLAADGVQFSPELFRTIRATYHIQALDLLEHYFCDATMNGLTVARQVEEATVETFLSSVMKAGDYFLNNPLEISVIPSWSRVESAIPDIYQRITKAVELDNAE